MERLYKNRLKYLGGLLLSLPGYVVAAWAAGAVGGGILGSLFRLDGPLWGGRIAIAVLFLLLFSIPGKPDYRVNDKEITLLRWGNTIKSYPFSDYKISSATMHLSYPGVPFFHQRFLLADDGRKQQKIGVNLKKQDVMDFISQVNRCQDLSVIALAGRPGKEE